MGNGKRPELKRKQICLFYLVMCFVSLFLMVKATDCYRNKVEYLK